MAVAGVLVLATASPALGADDVYRSPGYRGTAKAPRTLPPPPPTPIPLGSGRSPQVLVDAAGTAHITWSVAGDTNPDIVRYCRLKRGATACDAQADLVPQQSGDALAQPQFNDENGTPRVLAIGDQLVVLTSRYPNNLVGPDGEYHDRNTYLFASDDGGTSFQAPALVGTGPTSGQPAVFGPPDTPRIGLISDTVTGGTFFQAISGARFNAHEANLGGDGISSSLAPEGTSVMGAWSDLADTIHLRRWSGQGDVEDPANWSEATLPGTDPLLAGGPAGNFLLSRDGDQQLGVRRVNGGTPGARAVIPGTQNTGLRDIAEDASGRLIVTYRESTADGGVLRLRTSTDATTFSRPQTLAQVAPPADLWSSDVDAAADGGGFTVVHEGEGGAEGPIVALPFGTQAANGQAGLGGQLGSGLDPGVVSNCQQLKFGDVSIRATEGCLLPTVRDKAVRVAEGTLRLNGLEIVPEGDAKIVLDARAKTLDTTGTVRVQLRAPGITPIVLFRGQLHIRLRAEQSAQAKARAAADDDGGCTGQRLADFGGDAVLKGFPIKGSIAVFLSGESSCIPVSLEMPEAFGGVRGNAVLRADNERLLHVDSLHIGVSQVFVGPLLLEDLAIDYESAGDEWNGQATLGLPPQPGGAKLGAKVRFAGGAFKEGHLELTFPFPGIALDPFAVSYLHQVSGGFGLEPLFLEAGAGFGVLPIPPDAYTFEVNGNLRVTFGTPVTFDFNGDGKFFGFPVASERLLLTTDGLVKASGQVDIDLDVASVAGGIDAFVDAPHKRFSGKVTGEVCVLKCIDAAAVVSTRAIGACTPIGGFGHYWKDSLLDVDVMLVTCDLTDYEEPTPAGRAVAAQAGGSGFDVAGGQSAVNVRVSGAGGAPQVVLVSPSGDRIVPGTDPAGDAVMVSGGDRTFVGLRNPAAGHWTVEAADGSPAITALAVARALPAPEVSAKVGGHGRRRALSYRVTTGNGLRTTFLEVGRAGGRVIGVAKRSRGTLRFAPGPGPGGPRRIVALVERRGIPRLQETVATFVAPAPAGPRVVRGLRVARRGHSVTVRWRRTAGARSYAVRVELPDGRRTLQVVRRTKLRMSGAPRRGRVRVSVAGVSATGRQGPPARTRR
jgi:hypothetical protein